jgi:general secretion pathway protein A
LEKSLMYEKHFGFTVKPFSINTDPGILFLSRKYENILCHMEYALNEKVSFILLTGEIGVGKTTLVRYLRNKLESQFKTAVSLNADFFPGRLFEMVLNAFAVHHEETEEEGHLTRLRQCLSDQLSSGRSALLIIDEAQNLPDDALKDIQMLIDLQSDDQVLLQIILVGPPELKARLSLPENHQLARRIDVNYHINPLDREQTRLYIEYRLRKAGGRPDLFTQEAMEMVFSHSQGVPRSINLMCDMALVQGLRENQKQIDEAVIGRLIEDGIYVSVNPGRPVGRLTGWTTPEDDSETDIKERMQQVETSLTALKQRHEDFTQDIRNDLAEKYQQLLLAEQHRYDRLMDKYIRLLRAHPSPGAIEMAEKNGLPQEKTHQSYRSATKYSRLLKMTAKRKPSAGKNRKDTETIGNEASEENREG